MRTPNDLFPYQVRAIDHMVRHSLSMPWQDTGLGKTICGLTSFVVLQDAWETSALLVVGPLRVVQSVWRQEALKWSHTKHLRFSLIHGTEQQRRAALSRRADVYLINYEGLHWLSIWVRHAYLGKDKYPPFDSVIYDEVTKLKNAQSQRSKAIVPLLPFLRRRSGLTGECAENGYQDLHGMYLAVDQGKRLGTSITQYRDSFFRSGPFHSYRVTQYGKKQIQQRVADITLVLRAEDYLDLPPVITRDILIELPGKSARIYQKVEEEFFAELESGATIDAEHPGAKNMKCLQIANGACYVDHTEHWEKIHAAKLDVLEEILEEQGGSPVLLAYSFRHDAERIASRFPEARFLSSSLGDGEFNQTKDQFSRGSIPLLCGHPASMGYGVDGLQNQCHTVVWFGLPWSMGLYNQLNARIDGGLRRSKPVRILRILADKTLDLVVRAAQESKATEQKDLKRLVLEYRRKKQ